MTTTFNKDFKEIIFNNAKDAGRGLLSYNAGEDETGENFLENNLSIKVKNP